MSLNSTYYTIHNETQQVSETDVEQITTKWATLPPSLSPFLYQLFTSLLSERKLTSTRRWTYYRPRKPAGIFFSLFQRNKTFCEERLKERKVEGRLSWQAGNNSGCHSKTCFIDKNRTALWGHGGYNFKNGWKSLGLYLKWLQVGAWWDWAIECLSNPKWGILK